MTIKELLPLLFFFLVFTLFFALVYMTLGIDIDTTRPGPTIEDFFIEEMDIDIPIKTPPASTSKRSASPIYPGINKKFGYLLYSFRNSIGDLATPNYDDWLTMGLVDENN